VSYRLSEYFPRNWGIFTLTLGSCHIDLIGDRTVKLTESADCIAMGLGVRNHPNLQLCVLSEDSCGDKIMTKDQLARLERNVSTLQKLLSDLGNAAALAEFLKTIRKPGWTTPAEFRLVNGMIDSMTAQAKVLQGLRTSLTSGARLVR
jgi:hypothetical protein